MHSLPRSSAMMRRSTGMGGGAGRAGGQWVGESQNLPPQTRRTWWVVRGGHWRLLLAHQRQPCSACRFRALPAKCALPTASDAAHEAVSLQAIDSLHPLSRRPRPTAGVARAVVRRAARQTRAMPPPVRVAGLCCHVHAASARNANVRRRPCASEEPTGREYMT